MKFHPHIHDLVSDGAGEMEDEFLKMPTAETSIVVKRRHLGSEAIRKYFYNNSL